LKERGDELRLPLSITPSHGCDRFLLAATSNAVNSRWVPWELSYADKAKGLSNIAVIPIADPYGDWEGAEYMRLYPTAEISTTDQLVVFPPSSDKGRLIESWMSYGALTESRCHNDAFPKTQSSKVTVRED
jgi:hypothetical protein